MGKVIWKDIVGYEKFYKINNLGVVVSKPRDVINKHGIVKHNPSKVMKINYCGKYPMIGLNKNKVQSNFGLHRLLGIHFIPNPENKPQINHKNGIKTDFNLSNLEWMTISENNKHAFDTGLNVPYWKGKKRSVEFIKKLVESRKGLIPWNKGKRQKPPTHGSLYEYDEYGCRCDKCKKCMSDYNKIKKIRRENRNKNK